MNARHDRRRSPPILGLVKRPTIGIPPCVDARDRWRPGRIYDYIDHAYAAAIDHAGGLAVHLPMQSHPESLIAGVDGLLLPGGGDFMPAGPPPEGVAFDPTPETQMDFDRSLVRHALERRLPVLGICYGAQLIALEHGGSLHFHLPTDRPDAIEHALSDTHGRHEVRIEDGSRLEACLGPGEVSVSSLHHQGIRSPGDGLKVTARSCDDLIEGIEAPGEAFVVGVQWHPEKMDDDASAALFEAFIAACRSRRDASH